MIPLQIQNYPDGVRVDVVFHQGLEAVVAQPVPSPQGGDVGGNRAAILLKESNGWASGGQQIILVSAGVVRAEAQPGEEQCNQILVPLGGLHEPIQGSGALPVPRQ